MLFNDYRHFKNYVNRKYLREKQNCFYNIYIKGNISNAYKVTCIKKSKNKVYELVYTQY